MRQIKRGICILLTTSGFLFTLCILLYLFRVPVQQDTISIPSAEEVTASAEAQNGSSAEAQNDSSADISEPTTPSFSEYDISLMAVGDNLIHMGVVNTGKQSDGTYDYSFLFEGISDFLNTADIKIINQETLPDLMLSCRHLIIPQIRK